MARLTCAALLAGCVFGLSAAAASAATLNGAGSTLVAPIEAEWATAWGNATGNTVTYAAVGSGTGYKDIAQRPGRLRRLGRAAVGLLDAAVRQLRPDPVGADRDRRELPHRRTGSRRHTASI